MPIWLCEACGTSFPPADAPPGRCPICEDARQFVPPRGQGWTTSEALAAGHANAWRQLEPGLLQIETVPRFAIGQRALLLRTGAGNILWDCLALLDAATIELVRARFGAAPLYARVDLLPSPDGPVVVELELVEPSLVLGFGADAAERLAAAVAGRARR